MKLNPKTKSLYIAYYTYEDEIEFFWKTFVYSSSASDDELEKQFRNVVYKGEYGEKLEDDVTLDIIEITEARDYSDLRDYSITIRP